MATSPSIQTRKKTPAEAAGYIAGTVTGIASRILPIRMWITLLASAVLILYAFNSNSTLEIARGFCVFSSLVAVMGCSAVGRKQ